MYSNIDGSEKDLDAIAESCRASGGRPKWPRFAVRLAESEDLGLSTTSRPHTAGSTPLRRSRRHLPRALPADDERRGLERRAPACERARAEAPISRHVVCNGVEGPEGGGRAVFGAAIRGAGR